jgi:hypothetical protein
MPEGTEMSETGVRVFIPIPFPLYSESEGDWSDAAQNYIKGPRADFRHQLEAEYKEEFKLTSIGTGAALPSYFVELASDPFKAAATLFFTGAAIKKGFEGWGWVYTQLSKYFHRDPTFDREGAAFLVCKAIVDKMDGVPKSFQLQGFIVQHRLRYGDPRNVPDPGPLTTIESASQERVERASIYVFQVAADGRDFRARVDGRNVEFLQE